MQPVLQELVNRLQKAHGTRLLSVVLYGSAANEDHQDRYSDYNVLCVLQSVTVEALGASEPVFRWWREKGNPSPLLLSMEELQTSTDCFPIEFHDIVERHQILYGADVVERLQVDDSFYRARVEYELRARLLRLRQKAAGVLHDRALLIRLMADSLSTFCVLARHALRLHGYEAAFDKAEVLRQAHQRFGMEPEPGLQLLAVRNGESLPRNMPEAQVLQRYLASLQTLVAAVNGLEK